MARRERIAPVILVLGTVSVGSVWATPPDPPEPTREVWEQLDVVPMPKRVRLTGRDVAIVPGKAVLVVGAQKARQAEIGAEWINRRLRKLGCGALPVVSEANVPSTALRIVIGTRSGNGLIEQAAEAEVLNVGPSNPGRRGYEIRTSTDGRTVYLAGADAIGTLYACVTFAELFESPQAAAMKGRQSGPGDGPRAVNWRMAEVRDWPDLVWLAEGNNLFNPEFYLLRQEIMWTRDVTGDKVARYVEAMKKHIDRLLRWKFSALESAPVAQYWRRRDVERYREAWPLVAAGFREISAYARDRGLSIMSHCYSPFVGRQSEFPEAPERCATLHNGKRWRGTIRCWSMDEQRRVSAGRLAEFLAEGGVADMAFHDTDTGGFLNPAQWEYRCEVCRKRWGNDYATATLNKYMIYVRALREHAPGCRINIVFYPYSMACVHQESAEAHLASKFGPSPDQARRAKEIVDRYTRFYRMMAAKMPADVRFCLREAPAEPVRRFYDVIDPHGGYIGFKLISEQWKTFYDVSPSWAPGLLSGRDDMLGWVAALEYFVPLKMLAVRQYTWNTRTPGAQPLVEQPLFERWRDSEPRGEVYSRVLPLVTRNLFGPRAGPDIAEAVGPNVAYNQIFESPFRMRKQLDTYEEMKRQADEAVKGCAAADRVFAKLQASSDQFGMTPYALRRFLYIREVLHCCRLMATLRGLHLRAREEALKGELDKAQGTVADARAFLVTVRPTLERLIAERPPDPVYDSHYTGSHDHWRRWRLYTPHCLLNPKLHGKELGLSFERMGERLEQIAEELPALAASGMLPDRVVENLRKRSQMHVGSVDQGLTIDGQATEPEWARALPVEAFWTHPEWETIARADTRVRFLRDDDTLYMAAEMWMPAGTKMVAETAEDDNHDLFKDEHVELFLNPSANGESYFHIAVNALGAVYEKRVVFRKGQGGGLLRETDEEWAAPGARFVTTRAPSRWVVEGAIPLSALGITSWTGRWHVNVGRQSPRSGGEVEVSAPMRPKPRSFHDTSKFLRMQFDDLPAPPPQVSIEVAGLRVDDQTYDDGVATTCVFEVDLRSDRILHDVVFTAECLDARGEAVSNAQVLALDRLTFVRDGRERLRAVFPDTIKQGALRLVLTSAEATAGALMRIGDWPGAGTVAPLLARSGDRTEAADIRSSPALIAPCRFAGEVVVPGEEQPTRLLDRRRGTIEFWFRPLWTEVHPAGEVCAPWLPDMAFVYCGVLRTRAPATTNQSCFAILHDLGRNSLSWSIKNRNYAGWATAHGQTDRNVWRDRSWHHLACVWDHDADESSQLRLYVDGHRHRDRVSGTHLDRLGDDKGVEMDAVVYPVQLLSMSSGRRRARVAMDELRISRTPRYTADFEVVARELALDADTTALFHFNGTTSGEGVSAAGRRYEVRAVPGVPGYH